MRVDPTKLSDDELESMVQLAAGPGGRQLRKMLQVWLEAATAKLVEEPSDGHAGYTRALSDLCGIMDRGGAEMTKRKAAAAPDIGAEYWVE